MGRETGRETVDVRRDTFANSFDYSVIQLFDYFSIPLSNYNYNSNSQLKLSPTPRTKHQALCTKHYPPLSNSKLEL